MKGIHTHTHTHTIFSTGRHWSRRAVRKCASRRCFKEGKLKLKLYSPSSKTAAVCSRAAAVALRELLLAASLLALLAPVDLLLHR